MKILNKNSMIDLKNRDEKKEKIYHPAKKKEYAQAESAIKLVSYRERYNKEYMELKERLKEKIWIIKIAN